MRYPRNVRFSQRLKDLGVTEIVYFNVDEQDTLGAELAKAVYLKYYTSEIGVEELELFDMRMKNIYSRNVATFKALLETRSRLIEAGTETEVVTHGGEDVNVHGHKIESGTKAKVYVEVSDTDAVTENSGQDKMQYGRTETRTRTGNPDYYNRLQVITSDIYEKFTALFECCFMEVL